MQIRLTVLGPLSGHTTCACDVLVTAPAGTALAAVTSGLATAVAAAGSDLGSGAVVVHSGDERLDPQRCVLGEPPLIDGAVLSLGAPADPERHVPLTGPLPAAARLHVVSGPDAGGVHLLHGGEIRVGRSSSADIPLDDPDVSRLHCAVTLSDDGVVTLHDLGSTNGTTLDGAPVDGTPVPLAPGALLRVGESTLSLYGVSAGASGASDAPDAPDALPARPDGEGRLRVPVRVRGGSGESAVALPGAQSGAGAPGDAGALGAGLAGAGPAGWGAGARTGHAGADGPAGLSPAEDAGPGGRGVGARTGRTSGHTSPDGQADATASAGGGEPGWGAGARAGFAGGVPASGRAPASWGSDAQAARAGDPGQQPAWRSGGPLDASPDRDKDRTNGRGDGGTNQAAGFANLTGPDAEAPPGAYPPYQADAFGDGRDGGHATHTVRGNAALTPGTAAAPAQPPQADGGGKRRARGIGAWARRLTGGGRAAEQREATVGESPQEQAATGAPERAPDTAAALRERWPDPAAVLLTALGPGPRLWERGPGHPDLLTVRLGTADRYAPDGGGPLPSVPVTVGLREVGALGMTGPRERLSGLARSVLAQLAAFHAPGTLEYVLLSTDRSRPAEERAAEWSWLGWLPQLRPAHGQDCRLLVGYDREQAEARTAELVRRLDDGPLGTGWTTAPPEAVAAAAARHEGPYTVLIVDGDPGSTALRETVARLATGGPAAGIHVLCLAEAPATTPASPVSATLASAEAVSPAFAHCGAVALLSGDVATVVQVIHRASAPSAPVAHPVRPGHTMIAALDAVSGAWAERFARALAPLRMADNTGDPAHASRIAAALPRSSRLLDELGLARATPASLTARWAAATDRGTRPGGRAVAVLGAGPHGPLSVDLAADGPHLLVEGSPGSGKTELLRSLAASLAAADRPDRLSLVLVDGAAAERGEGLRVCTDLPHVSTYLAAADPVRMREFAQALASELKRRAELLGTLDFVGWHDRNPAPGPNVVGPRRPAEPMAAPAPVAAAPVAAAASGSASGSGIGSGIGTGVGSGAVSGSGAADLESAPSGTLKLRTQSGGRTRTAETALPRLVVLVDDFDALVAPALGSTGRPAAGSVVRALEAVARDGERLGVHLIAASGRPDRTADTAAVERAGLRVTLDIAPPSADAGGDGPGAGEPAPGRGRLRRPDDDATTPFQAGRVTGRIPRTATLRPTVVTLDWQRLGDPPTRRPVRELGNGPTDLALLASALQRAAQSAGAQAAPPLL
ncbi:FtsK/SpoIIIE domain-containing protein [Streptomyces hesseae]|uniref:FtsK/SpoIIIE domain-containing protein n=1 Tax=Streptomyces hesseae TaxID=3075519 RepID=A0ABU2T094_9ACTN|nr:FtsK/SpoIIIE domain-containing protein [Streptomyces sp. DSM 40473]MDT0453695.1 FtsK/SpoIIIE domain-containing protein [Streptomyces sp. DSM 40473]